MHTVCESARCPNMGECWGAGTATFMILGNVCTRSCGFCAVATGRPTELDRDEPVRVAEAIKLMGVKHAVLTSVNRDELKSRGMDIWAAPVEQIRRTKEAGLRTKSGFMVGLGETPEEVYEIMEDLLVHGCDVVTIGQYLQPTKMHLPVSEFIHPDLFNHYKEVGLQMGLKYVESGPLVRSSYHAERHI